MSDTESFESAARSYNNYTWIGRDGVKRAIDRLKAAHDREIRDTAQQEYHRGFEDGTHSMDAEHRAIAMRLRGLRFDGGSHENLSRIAYAIYPCATGWTCESAAGLRDKLIDLMGGVSDDTCGVECCCAAAACDGRDSGKPKEVKHGGAAHDCAADTRGGAGCDVVHMDGLVAYDVLDNERRKAVRALRRWKPEEAIDNDHCGEIQIRLLYQFLGLGGAMMMDGADAAKKVRDRLIHLLGGDECNFSAGESYMNAMGEKSNPAETSGASTDHVILDTPSPDDGTSPNDVPTSSITDELRKWADGDVWSCKWEEFKAIADRIDEQFARVCQQQETVLQETIDGMVDDRDSDQLRIEKLVRQRDAAYACADELSDELLRVRRERDEARNECDRLKCDMLDKWVPRTSYEEKVEKYRRAYMESDAWRKSLQEKLNAMRDAITAALNG